MLYGRDAERARLAASVDEARAGRAGVLVVLGDPGVGKTALLRELVSGVEPSVRVLSTAGVESEAPLPFAALYRLLRPVLDEAQLPPPQARALRIAFGQEQSDVALEPFLVGVATLSVLTDAADERPLLCVVDDAHWLDAASGDALLFAARQLQADPVAMVFAARDTRPGSFRPDSLPTVRLGGLEPGAARRLLSERAGRPTSADVTDRLLAETGGNPLALLELPGTLTTEQLRGTASLPERLVLTERVEEAFLTRARLVGPQARTLLLVACADDTGRGGVVRRAAAALDAGPAAWDEAERSGLLQVVADDVAVRHPLVRSAVYQSATSGERHRAHGALADALADDPDRQAWHRALASDVPDPATARALHEVGDRAERRGANRAASDAFERAAALTPDEGDRAVRLLAAGRNAWAGGDAARTRSLADAARALADDVLLLADVDRLRGRVEMNVGSAADGHRIFTLAAAAVAPVDPDRALEMATAAEVARSHGVDSGARLPDGTVDVSPAPTDTGRIRCLKQLLVSMRHDVAHEHAAAVSALQVALETALNVPDATQDLDLLGNLGNAALHLGDDDGHRRFYTLMLSSARARGDGMRVLYALQRLAFSQYTGGLWSPLRSSSEEAVTLGLGAGQASSTAAPRAWLTVLAALQGRGDFDERLTATRELVAANPPVGVLAQPVEDLLSWAQGAQSLVTGAAPAALHHFDRMRLPALGLMAAPERIEAAVRAGDGERARRWVAELDAFGDGPAPAWARAAADLGRALLAEDEGDRWFRSALTHHETADRPFARARVQLAYGEFLRRNGRRLDARDQLRPALATFEDLDAGPFAERAAQELRASGETARKRDPSTLRDLTPMEIKVARLVGQGLSNKDVAAQCWVSPRTVGFHLRNVFAKLGISSRGQLAQLDLG